MHADLQRLRYLTILPLPAYFSGLLQTYYMHFPCRNDDNIWHYEESDTEKTIYKLA